MDGSMARVPQTTLCKGKRGAELVRLVFEGISERASRSFWDVFVELETCFEEIAAGGAERLSRSQG
jgi:hypothetical protein